MIKLKNNEDGVLTGRIVGTQSFYLVDKTYNEIVSVYDSTNTPTKNGDIIYLRYDSDGSVLLVYFDADGTFESTFDDFRAYKCKITDAHCNVEIENIEE